MEVTLNLIWLSIAFAAAAGFVRWRRGRSARQARYGAIAIICALAVLFPIISATDDLINDPAYVAELAAVRRTAFAAVCQLHIGIVAVLPHIDVLSSVAHFARLLVGFAAVDADPQLLSGFIVASPLRGPPSSR
jgi:hypothetical protein